MAGNYNDSAYSKKSTDSNVGEWNWGQNATTSDVNVFKSQSRITNYSRNFLNSRLWHGVPQLTDDQMAMFESAHTGHTFIFVISVPRFMTEGAYKDRDGQPSQLHLQMKNLKAVIERASMGFGGFSPIQANTDNVEDGAGRKISHVTSVTKEQSNISIRLHEFNGLVVKNAIEAWLTGIFDPKSQHGNYHGNLGIKHGWCLANHSMSILVVQTTPDWTTIQDAAYYYNMVPTEVPFDHFNWTKGEHELVQDYDIDFVCNEERSPAIMLAAEKFMNNKVLSLVGTSVYNSRQFVAHDFSDNLKGTGTEGIKSGQRIIDPLEYNAYITNADKNETEDDTAVKKFPKAATALVNGEKENDPSKRYVNDDGTNTDTPNYDYTNKLDMY